MATVSRVEAFEGGFCFIRREWEGPRNRRWNNTPSKIYDTENYEKTICDLLKRFGLEWQEPVPDDDDDDDYGFDHRKRQDALADALKGEKAPNFDWFEVGVRLHYEIYFNDEIGPIRSKISMWGQPPQLRNSHALSREYRRLLENAALTIEQRDQFEERLLAARRFLIRERVKWYNVCAGPLVHKLREELRMYAGEQDERERRSAAREPSIGGHSVSNTFIISGSNFGVVAANIESDVHVLNQNSSTREVGEAIRSLADAVGNLEQLTRGQKVEVLEMIEALSAQAKVAESERKPGLLKPTLKYLPELLSSVEKGAKLWSDYGPAIEGYFRRVFSGL